MFNTSLDGLTRLKEEASKKSFSEFKNVISNVVEYVENEMNKVMEKPHSNEEKTIIEK